MANVEAKLTPDEEALYKALGIEGVVRRLENQGGKGKNEEFVKCSTWLNTERKRQRFRDDLKFWMPQSIAIISAIVAVVAVMI